VTPSAPLLELSGITKRYPGVTALDAVDFTVQAGLVHAVVGENGAGKSTMLRLIAGATRPDAGVMRMDGRPLSLSSPREALQRGITVIYQELALVPSLGADANIYLGMEPARSGVLDRDAIREGAAKALGELGLFIDPGTPVGRLSVAQQQLVELARGLVRDARLVALDEPTAALTAHEVAHLAAQIQWLRAKGIGVIFVSHRLDEVRRLADHITVLRDGRRVWSGTAQDVDDAGLIRAMVGRDVAFQRLAPAHPPAEPPPPLLAARGLSRGAAFQNVSLTLRRGEIVALAGLVGAGRSEVARCLAGIDRWDAGSVSLRDVPYHPRDPRHAIAQGVVYLPEDRKREGLILDMLVRENVTLPTLPRYATRGVLSRSREAAVARAAVTEVDLRPPDIERPVLTLSGGNQQKVVLTKWLLAQADVLLFDEPTRGVDIAAKAEWHRQIRALADGGKAILLISSELAELLALADRALVMRAGRLVGELAGENLTAEGVMTLAFRAA